LLTGFVIEMSGSVRSTMNVIDDGVASLLPALSTARTSIVFWPSGAVCGIWLPELQVCQPPPLRLHSKWSRPEARPSVGSGSVPLKLKVGRVE